MLGRLPGRASSSPLASQATSLPSPRKSLPRTSSLSWFSSPGNHDWWTRIHRWDKTNWPCCMLGKLGQNGHWAEGGILADGGGVHELSTEIWGSGPLLWLFLLRPWVPTHFFRAMDPIKCGPNLWAIITGGGSSLCLGGALGGQGDKQDFLPKMLGQTLALVLKGDSAGWRQWFVIVIV